MTASRKPLSRADQVRSRRAKDIKQRVMIATDTIKQPERYTPIVTRGESEKVPILQQAKKKARRKFYLAIGRGAEIRLPALPIFKPGWRLVSGLLLVLAGLGVYTLWSSPYFRVAAVTLDGASRVSLEEVQQLAPMQGQRMLTIMPDQIAKAILNTYPVLADVNVTVGFPSTIQVKVIEREPVLQWVQDGKTQWISAEGIAFEPKGEAADLVTINAAGAPPSGKSNLTLVKQENRKSLASIILNNTNQDKTAPLPVAAPKVFMDPQMIPALKAIATQIPEGVQLVYHPLYGIGWYDPDGWKVFFGMNPNDMPAKLNMYREIVSKLKAQGVEPKLISMENLYAPYYRTEK